MSSKEVLRLLHDMIDNRQDFPGEVVVPSEIMSLYKAIDGGGLCMSGNYFKQPCLKVCIFNLTRASDNYFLEWAFFLPNIDRNPGFTVFPLGVIYYLNPDVYKCGSELIEYAKSGNGPDFRLMSKRTLLITSNGSIYSFMDNTLLKHASSLEDFFERF